jgi:hypothetical protein
MRTYCYAAPRIVRFGIVEKGEIKVGPEIAVSDPVKAVVSYRWSL